MPLPLHGDVGSGHAGLDAGLLLAAAGLGVFHGINPGMGWLFAVSYGLQERSVRAILRTLVPITIGHEASVLPMALAITVFASQVTRAATITVFSVGLVVFGLLVVVGAQQRCGVRHDRPVWARAAGAVHRLSQVVLVVASARTAVFGTLERASSSTCGCSSYSACSRSKVFFVSKDAILRT